MGTETLEGGAPSPPGRRVGKTITMVNVILPTHPAPGADGAAPSRKTVGANCGHTQLRRNESQKIATTSPPRAYALVRLMAGSKKNCASGCTTSHGAMANW